jgi:ubiquinone/menaquinone biosynthesis C-methylase UbiE
MAAVQNSRLYECPGLQAVIGPALRPGGIRLTRRGLSFCDLPVGSPVVDIGCGSALTVDYLRQEHRFRACGLDLSPVMLAQARQRDVGLPLIRATATRLPFRDASLSAVICECVLSLVNDARRSLQEFCRVLAPGGYLVLTDVYVRMPEHNHLLESVSVDCCLKGAGSREAMLRRLQESEFSLLVWEDHSQELKRLAAQLAFAGWSLAAIWDHCGAGAAFQDARIAIQRARPGYFLLVAHKRDQR